MLGDLRLNTKSTALYLRQNRTSLFFLVPLRL